MKLNMKRGLVFLLILTLMSSVMPFAFAANDEKGWAQRPSLNYGRFYSQAQVVDGKIYVIGGTVNSMQSSSVEAFDPSTKKWEIKASMKHPKTAFQTVVLNNKLYAIGDTYAEAYDPEKDIWTEIAPLNYYRRFFQAQIVDGKIYVFGGSQDYKYSNSDRRIEVYDPETNQWSVKAAMKQPRSRFTSGVLDGKIYAIGGTSGEKEYLRSVERYDPRTDSWESAPDLPVQRMSVSNDTIVYNNKIYIFGGYNGSSSLKSLYAFDSNTWSTLDTMPFSSYYNQVEIAKEKIYCMGGANSTGTINDFAVYDIKTNQWTRLQSMIAPRSNFVTAIFQGEVFAISGYVSDKSFPSGVSVNPVVESYKIEGMSPTLTVTASPNRVKVGNRFTTTVAIHNVSNIYAEDIKIDYDAERFEYLGASAKDGLKIYKEDTSKPGSVRFIVAHLGKDSGATGDKDLIELTFKAKSVGIGKVDITKGRIADNDVLEMDVAEENCGEDTIEVEANKDVNRTGEYTLLDLGIDAYYYGMQADQTDTTRFDTDVIPDGVIDDKDLTAITQSILDNSNYPFN
ncbi:MAG: kelch repeat-containing protein [Clostridium sp.]|uniref:kelch repeat-containing protein n=1 Tax=Clostridium sp. TaxID=1506 RepID=UPI00290A9A59|nr:kelch repeat-containing protein [Clostridium sp.]MDU7337596.1 kelch repeat-containing protein [Clostridium sp.]